MSNPFTGRSDLGVAFAELYDDLVHDDGPKVSTMRNYRFALLQYDPTKEFDLREHTRTLAAALTNAGWAVLSLDLHRLFLARLRSLGEPSLQRLITKERHLASLAPERGLTYLQSKIGPLIEGRGGLAGDCAARIRQLVGQLRADDPDRADRALVLIGRAGAVYPFYRSSALLEHLDGQTGNVPVVLLYPGERRSQTGLSFMGELAPDHDYRPRIYPLKQLS